MGNQALSPCLSSIEDGDPEKSQNNQKENKPNLMRRLLHLATTADEQSQSGNGQNFGNLVIKEIQESVMDIMKDGLPPNIHDHFMDKIGRYLRPIDGPPQKKRLFNMGEGRSGIRVSNPDAIQDFATIKKSLLQKNELFEDSTFPARYSSLYFDRNARNQDFVWLRPSQIAKNPQFFVEGVSRFDVKQGELGNCWLLAGLASLTLHQDLFHQVVPEDQYFDRDYAGIFHFRFWQYGNWIDVVIDDRLPTRNGKLVYMQSDQGNEFWSALVEKAYAKLHGSYEALKGGSIAESMEDLTGGLAEHFQLKSKECPSDLFSLLRKCYERRGLMGCSIEPDNENEIEFQMENGLVKAHAYSITQVDEIEFSDSNRKKKIPVLRIRNPWGTDTEWKGAFGDRSMIWSHVSDEEKSRLGLTIRADGEFWIALSDFKANFTSVMICNLGPHCYIEDETHEKTCNAKDQKHWEEKVFEGSWISGISAGGCRNYENTFYMNPQYVVKLTDHDEDDENDKCTMIVALMQKNRRKQQFRGGKFLSIGVLVYSLDELVEKACRRTGKNLQDLNIDRLVESGQLSSLLGNNFYKYSLSLEAAPWLETREYVKRYSFKPGYYLIIPSTFEPNVEGEFRLRIFTEKPPGTIMENDEENCIIVNREDEPPKPIKPSNKEKEGKSPTYPDHIQKFFVKIAGEDMEIGPEELQRILNVVLKKDYKFEEFSLESCRSMVAMMDKDRTGKLGIDEFIHLWTQVKKWCEVFKKHDRDANHVLHADELRDALRESNLIANRHTLQSLVLRYGHVTRAKNNYVKVERSLSFDSFILCCIKLKHSIELWSEQAEEQHDNDDQPLTEASFTLDKFIESLMYC